MHASATGGRRLLRLSGFGARAAGPGAERHRGERDCGRVVDGEPAGEFAEPMRDCAGPAGGVLAVGESIVF